MKSAKLLIFLLILTFGVSVSAEAAKISTGEDVIAAMHKKYQGKWYKTFTFTQKTTSFKPDGTTENGIWHEALSMPGKLRVDIEPLASGNGFIFNAGTQHSFQNGKLVRSTQTAHALLILGFDVYFQTPAETVKQLQGAKFDTSVMHEDTWQGRPVYVVGAKSGDLKSAQFWIDKKNLYFVRLIQPVGKEGKSSQEIQFNKYYKAKGGGWVSPEVVFNVDGKRVFLEEYFDVQTDVPVDEKLFDPNSFMTVDRDYVKKKN